MGVEALEASDGRKFDVRVAGTAALLVAKVYKIRDGSGTTRLTDKDALDVLRLLRGTTTDDLAGRMQRLLRDDNARPVAEEALHLLGSQFANRAGEGASRWPSGRSVRSANRRKSPPPARCWLATGSEPWAVEPIELAHGSASHDRGRQVLPASSRPARSGVSGQTCRAVFSAGGGEDPETVPQPRVAPCTKDGFPPAVRMPSYPLRECRHWSVRRCMISRTLFSGCTTSNGKQNSVSPWPATLSLNSYSRGESNERVCGYISATEPQPNFLP